MDINTTPVENGVVLGSVDRSSAIPVYFQVASDLRRRIGAGDWPKGGKIPPETTLAEDYDVSRVTVRQALAELVKDGLVDRRRGSGTYVRHVPKPMVYDLSLARREAAAMVGDSNRADVLSLGRLPDAPAEIRRRLQAGPDAELVYMVRRIILNDQPAALLRSWFDRETVPGIESSDKLGGSIASILLEDYGLKPTRTDNQIEVVRSTREAATLLGNSVDVPLIVVTATSYLEDGRPIEFSQTEWLGDRIRLHVTAHSESERDTPTTDRPDS